MLVLGTPTLANPELTELAETDIAETTAVSETNADFEPVNQLDHSVSKYHLLPQVLDPTHTSGPTFSIKSVEEFRSHSATVPGIGDGGDDLQANAQSNAQANGQDSGQSGEQASALATDSQRLFPVISQRLTLPSLAPSDSASWSMSRLAAAAAVTETSLQFEQTAFEADNVDHLELAWNDTQTVRTSGWINDLSADEPLDEPLDALSHENLNDDVDGSPGQELVAKSDAFVLSPQVDSSAEPLMLRLLSGVRPSETALSETTLSETAETIGTLATAREEERSVSGDLIRQSAQALEVGALNLEKLDAETPRLRRRERDLLSEILDEQGVVSESFPILDDELGTLRLIQLRSRDNEDLGVLRLLQTAEAAPPPKPAPIAFLGGRLGFVNVDNVFRSPVNSIEEQIYQAGLALYLSPKLSDNTGVYAIAETNIARYNEFSEVNYNEIQLQIGLRHRFLPQTYAQIGWRNQRLYSPGYREKLFGVQYLDALVSHRAILTPRTWVDGFYQMRLGFADPEEASRFRQTLTLSLNYGVSRNLRTSLLYQLDFDDYTQIDRFDTYQQILGLISYNITPESRISLFGGTRFGNSSDDDIDLDDTFYGAGLNVNVPLF